MKEISSDKTSNNFSDEIDLLEFFNVLLAGKWIIISVTAFISIIAVIYSLTLPNIYESKALLVPVKSSGSISGALGGFSALWACRNKPPNSDEGNTQKAIKKINSLSFFENKILANIYLPELMAVKTWNSKTNTLVFDENIYDVKNNVWARNYSYPQQKIPSAQEAYKIFMDKHLRLNQDKNFGFITLTIKHQSPFVAKQWAELIVNEINSFYRLKDKLETEKAVSYLNQQILLTNLSEIKESLAQLLQEQTKKLTLVEANEFYVFDYIDPPAVMETKSEPNRALTFILGGFLGALLSILFVLIRHYAFSKKTT